MLKKLKPFAAAAAAALSLNTFAAVDMFLKLDGIEGESRDKTHAKEIDVLAWSWGMSQSGTLHVGGGGGGGAGKANFQDISVTKWVDKSSVPLMQYLATSQYINEATLVVRHAGSEPYESEEIVMHKVIVTSVSTGGSGGEDKLTENITLNFEAFCITYTQQGEGGKAGEESKLCWNIAANNTCSVAQVGALFELPLVKALPRQLINGLNPICSNT